MLLSHFLRGKCGLKSAQYPSTPLPLSSLPSREVWIEIQPERRIILKILSLPSREVWIEISLVSGVCSLASSLPSREVWIEIGSGFCVPDPPSGHFLRGKCGLKFRRICHNARLIWSLPSREVWIEIISISSLWNNPAVTSFAGSVDWNSFGPGLCGTGTVTSFAGSVDWNRYLRMYEGYKIVTSFAGSVDWNY